MCQPITVWDGGVDHFFSKIALFTSSDGSSRPFTSLDSAGLTFWDSAGGQPPRDQSCRRTSVPVEDVIVGEALPMEQVPEQLPQIAETSKEPKDESSSKKG